MSIPLHLSSRTQEVSPVSNFGVQSTAADYMRFLRCSGSYWGTRRIAPWLNTLSLLTALIAARVCAVLSDVIVLFATWARTWPTREGKDFATTVSAVLFEDGEHYRSIYFAHRWLMYATLGTIYFVYVRSASRLSLCVSD